MCIPHEEGIQACAEALKSFKEKNPNQPDTETLVNLLQIVLKNNTFEFDGKCYIQLQGTAMGTKLAPAYANIFMGKLEESVLSSAPLKPSYYNATLMIYSSSGHTQKLPWFIYFIP